VRGDGPDAHLPPGGPDFATGVAAGEVVISLRVVDCDPADPADAYVATTIKAGILATTAMLGLIALAQR
jgi:hypothetical protein